MVMVAMIVIAGCSTANETQKEDNIPEIIEVSVQTDPPIVKTIKLAIIQAKVTQGEDVVNDANEVKV